MTDHRKRFERWRKALGYRKAFLVSSVVRDLVPLIESRGYVWYGDFAGGDGKYVAANEIPMQKREGEEWPTIQIVFHDRQSPWFRIHFGEMPIKCKRWTASGFVWVEREKAILVEAPAQFTLLRARWRGPRDSEFGYNLYSLLPSSFGLIDYLRFRLMPERCLKNEVSQACELIKKVLDILDDGIPDEWLNKKFGPIEQHVALSHSWHMHEPRTNS